MQIQYIFITLQSTHSENKNKHTHTFLAVDVQISLSVLRAVSLSEHSEELTAPAGSAPVETEREQLAAPGCWHSTGNPHKSQHELLAEIFLNAQISTRLPACPRYAEDVKQCMKRKDLKIPDNLLTLLK